MVIDDIQHILFLGTGGISSLSLRIVREVIARAEEGLVSALYVVLKVFREHCMNNNRCSAIGT